MPQIDTEQTELDQADAEQRERMSALDKALSVLDILTETRQPMGLPDLTAKLDQPRQTVHRILKQLEENGLVLRDPARERYSLGPRLMRLALSALSSQNHTAPARGILEELVADIEETCNIGVLDGLDFHYLERIECHWSLRVHLTAGSRVPAYCTSGGKVMLAHLEPELCNKLLQSKRLKSHTDQTTTRIAALQTEFEEIREKGYALNNQEFSLGIIGAAVPILDTKGRALAALALHGPEPRLSMERAKQAIPRLQAAAKRLSKIWEL